MWKSKYNKILNIGAYNTILMNDPLCKESISVKKLYLDTSGDPIIIPQVAIMLTVICLQQITTFQENTVLARLQVRPAPDIMDITREEVGSEDPAPDEAGRAHWHVQ